jgi:cobalamin biosynthesis protein CbiG
LGHSGIAGSVDIVATLPGEDGTSPVTSPIEALLAAGYGCRAVATAAAKVLAGTAIEAAADPLVEAATTMPMIRGSPLS